MVRIKLIVVSKVCLLIKKKKKNLKNDFPLHKLEFQQTGPDRMSCLDQKI